MDYNKVLCKLNEIDKELLDLSLKHYSQGRENYYKCKQSVEMIIRRIYPHPQEIEKKLFSQFSIGFPDEDDSTIQSKFINDIMELRGAISTIKEESELFGFKDFTPIKKKTETSFGLSKDTFGFKRSIIKEK